MDRARVEQIARLYVTQPGVTADGIMTKMGIWKGRKNDGFLRLGLRL